MQLEENEKISYEQDLRQPERPPAIARPAEAGIQNTCGWTSNRSRSRRIAAATRGTDRPLYYRDNFLFVCLFFS